MIKKTILLIISFVVIVCSKAQNGADSLANQLNLSKDSSAIELLKRDGKIYTVVAVLLLILICVFLYLWRLDRKIEKLNN